MAEAVSTCGQLASRWHCSPPSGHLSGGGGSNPPTSQHTAFCSPA